MKTINLSKFVGENFKSLQKATIASKAPLFKGVMNPLLSNEDVKILTAMGKNIPLLPLQVQKVLASAASLDEHSRVIYSGDTGIGKTISGIALAFLYAVRRLQLNPKASFNTVVVAPPHLVKKWQNEARRVLSDVIQINIIEVRGYQDFDSLTKKGEFLQGFNLFVVSKMKNAASYRSKQVFVVKQLFSEFETEERDARNRKVVMKRKGLRWHYTCPDCGASLCTPTPAKVNGEKVAPKAEPLSKTQTSCRKCEASLMQPISGGKISPAEYLGRYGKTGCIDMLLVDEIHEEKERDTLRSKAFGQLVSKSKKVVGLTGTFLGGYASHAFYTLFRMFPTLFKKDLGVMKKTGG